MTQSRARCRWLSWVLALGLGGPGLARAQENVVQPAENARERAAEAAPEAPPEPEAAASPEPEAAAGPSSSPPAGGAVEARTREPGPPPPATAPRADERRAPSYVARAVVPPAPGTLKEDERIGDYAQPRWSAVRRFPGTRMYVVPAGTLGVEWWLEDKQNLRDLDKVRYRSQYEFEMGLGHRLQLDLYLQTEQNGHHGPLQVGAEKAELRYALADWGVIPLNPTLYAEFVRQNGGPPKVELKALFGDQIAPRWHMGFNLVWEHELASVSENEYSLTTGLSYTLHDSRFALGAEVLLELVDESGDRFAFHQWELLAGPSLAWAPVPPMHVLLAALLGNEKVAGRNNPLLEPTLVVGWEI